MQLNVAVLRRNVLRHRAAGAIYRWPDPWGEMGGGVDIHNTPGCKHIEPSTAKVRLHFAADSTTGIQPAVMCKHRTTLNYATPNSRATVCVCVCVCVWMLTLAYTCTHSALLSQHHSRTVTCTPCLHNWSK